MANNRQKQKQIERHQLHISYQRATCLRRKIGSKADERKREAAFENSTKKVWQLTSNVTINQPTPGCFRVRLMRHRNATTYLGKRISSRVFSSILDAEDHNFDFRFANKLQKAQDQLDLWLKSLDGKETIHMDNQDSIINNKKHKAQGKGASMSGSLLMREKNESLDRNPNNFKLGLLLLTVAEVEEQCARKI